jgi:hypothetical protein
MSISRKAREAKRAKAFDRSRGRKPGSVPLRKLDMRFEIAVYALLTRPGGRLHKLKGKLMRAAEFAACFNESNTVTDYYRPGSATEEELRGLSFDYTGGRGIIDTKRNVAGRTRITHKPEERGDARLTRALWISRNAPGLISGATDEDAMWLQVSMTALDTAFNAIATNNADALRYALTVLQSPLIDWPLPILNSFLKLQPDQGFTNLLFHQ